MSSCSMRGHTCLDARQKGIGSIRSRSIPPPFCTERTQCHSRPRKRLLSRSTRAGLGPSLAELLAARCFAAAVRAAFRSGRWQRLYAPSYRTEAPTSHTRTLCPQTAGGVPGRGGCRLLWQLQIVGHAKYIAHYNDSNCFAFASCVAFSLSQLLSCSYVDRYVSSRSSCPYEKLVLAIHIPQQGDEGMKVQTTWIP